MKRLQFWAPSAVVLILLFVAAIAIGSVALSPREVLDGLRGDANPEITAIVRSLRLPRVALAALVGAALAASGSALQGTLRNPLAEPYLLGVSGGAAVGAVAGVALFDLGPALVPVSAFVGAVASISCVLLVARAAGGRSDPRILLMAGVVIGAFGNALIMVLLSSTTPERAKSALWWMMGSAADAEWVTVGWLGAYVLVAGALLAYAAPQIDALSLGEEPAASLGVDVDRATWRVFLLASLLAAASVAAAGLVGFVGLVVPHIARAFGIRRQRELVPAAMLVGASLLVAADLIARTAQAPRELPLGAVTALMGVPYFLLRLGKIR